MLVRSIGLAALSLYLVACGGAPATPSPSPTPTPSLPPPIFLEFPVWEATIPQMQEAMASGRVTSAALLTAYLDRIAAYDRRGPALNTMIRLNPHAPEEAAALDRERKEKGPRGQLHGIPIVLKDNYDTADLPTTAASISLAGAMPGRDGFITARLRAAGAVLVGKTNLMEFAMGITTTSSLGGQTRNPYDPARYPGGSSGGTAAAVTASLAAVGWGTDTCGSIRVPSAFNSLVGLRPSKGITSLQGIIPLSATQDVAGPLARTITDLAIALDATVAIDPDDPASAQWVSRRLPRFTAALDGATLRGARFGAVKEFFGNALEETEVSAIVRAALGRIQKAGGEVVELSIPTIQAQALSASVIAFEFRENLNAYLQRHPAAPIRSLQEILDRGLYLAELRSDLTTLNTSPGIGSAGYVKAMANRAALKRLLQRTLSEHKLDALVYPTVRRPPSLIGDPQIDPNCEASANSGFPALSLPAGFTDQGLPVGLELLGAPLTDARLVALGYAWERLTAMRQPPRYTPPLQRAEAPRRQPIRVTLAQDSMKANIAFTFDIVTGLLTYTVAITGLPPDDMLAVSLHQPFENGTDGPVIAALMPPGMLTRDGAIALPVSARPALAEGKLYVSLLTRQHPRGALRGNLIPPSDLVPISSPMPLTPKTKTP